VTKEWSLHTGDGSVTLRVPQTLVADVELHTNDGHISLNLPVEVNGRLGGNNIRGKLNGGGRTLSVHTGDGSITLGRS
jgi:putative adhesin